jgi:ribose 5-phosphate isomerase B
VKIAIASDHRGFAAKKRLIPTLAQAGHEVVDLGCDSSAACDYPDFAVPAARAVAGGSYEAAILIDGSGIGMSIAANKIRGVRAALAHDDVTARSAREHNHCNVLCLGSDLLGEEHLRQITLTFLDTPFQDGRHTRRIRKIDALDESR